jgi:LDH2 family malate/lactate/ureidoglycolate dehydrogenase
MILPIMATPFVTISADELTRFCEAILHGASVPEHKASLVARSLVASNLRGVDSHGVQLLPYYVEQIEAGDMNPHTDGHVVSELGSNLVYDADNGMGQPISEICCGHGIRIAKEHGMSMVVARESNHFGAAAWWAQKYSEAGLIGVVMCNASPMVPPWQGKQPRVGTNPICVAVPGGRWLLDMATTTVAANKIYKAMINGHETIPAGWAMDPEGVPTTSVKSAMNGGLVSPLGGYKGSGLAMLVEIFCAVLSGGAMSTELGGIRIRGRHMRVSQMFMGIDVSRFLPMEEFSERMEKLIGMIKATPPAKGYDEVMVAGDPEWRMEAERASNGIPLEQGTWEFLQAAAAKVGQASWPVQVKI